MRSSEDADGNLHAERRRKMILEETLKKIKAPSDEAMEACRRHWDGIAKPMHSLGKMEDYLIKIA